MMIGIVVLVGVLAVFALCACSSDDPRVEGGGGEHLDTAPTELGVAPSGVEHEVTAENGKAKFMVDDAYATGMDDNKAAIFTFKEGQAPAVKLSVVENTTDQDMEEVLKELTESVYKNYKKRSNVTPTKGYMTLGGREVGRIDYSFYLDSRSFNDKLFNVEATDDQITDYKGLILVDYIDGYYFTWFATFLADDEATPAVVERAMETTTSLMGESED